MGNYKTFIKDFNKCKDVIKEIYAYGCYGRNISSAKNKKLDNEIRRIKDFFGQNYDEKFIGKKYINFKFDSFLEGDNFLANIFFGRTFLMNDLKLYFYLLFLIEDGDKINDILDKVSYYTDVDSSTIKRKVKELKSEGILICKLDKNAEKYFFYKNKFRYSYDEIKQIQVLIGFYKNITPFKVPGFYLEETINNNNYEPVNQIFSFKNNHLHNILDESNLYSIQKYKFVEVNFEGEKYNIKYLKDIKDNLYGRDYILGEYDNFVRIFRLDRIKSTKKIKESLVEKYYEEFDENVMWQSSLDPNKKQYTKQLVEAIFYLDKIEDKVFIERLHREKKHGIITKIDKGRYNFKIEIIDPNEMVPWFRSFEGYVVVLNEEISKKLSDERVRWLESYGVF